MTFRQINWGKCVQLANTESQVQNQKHSSKICDGGKASDHFGKPEFGINGLLKMFGGMWGSPTEWIQLLLRWVGWLDLAATVSDVITGSCGCLGEATFFMIRLEQYFFWGISTHLSFTDSWIRNIDKLVPEIQHFENYFSPNRCFPLIFLWLPDASCISPVQMMHGKQREIKGKFRFGEK
mgnify:CR=1 FL=1